MILIPLQKLSSSPWRCLDCRRGGEWGKFYWVNANFQIVFLHIVLTGGYRSNHSVTQLTLNLIRSVWYWCKTKCYQGSYLKYLWDLCFTITPPGLAQMHWVSVLTPTYLRYSPCWHAFRIWSLFCNWSYHIIYVFAKSQTASFFAHRYMDHFSNCPTRSSLLQIVLPDLSHRESLDLLVTGY